MKPASHAVETLPRRDADLQTPGGALAEPHLFRFGLRQFFTFVTALAGMCGAVALTEGVWPYLIVGVSALFAAHVLGNLLGTRLRNSSLDVQRWNGALGIDAPPASRPTGPLPAVDAPPTPLASRTADSTGKVLISSLVGASLGAFVGAIGVSAVGGEGVTWSGVAVVALSISVLGGWIGFLASGFFINGRRAWNHATDHDARTRLGRGKGRA